MSTVPLRTGSPSVVMTPTNAMTKRKRTIERVFWGGVRPGEADQDYVRAASGEAPDSWDETDRIRFIAVVIARYKTGIGLRFRVTKRGLHRRAVRRSLVARRGAKTKTATASQPSSDGPPPAGPPDDAPGGRAAASARASHLRTASLICCFRALQRGRRGGGHERPPPVRAAPDAPPRAVPCAPAPAVELLDDAEVAARVASGELRRLTDFGPTPVDEIAVAELRDEMERRRLGDRDYEPQEPRDNGARS